MHDLRKKRALNTHTPKHLICQLAVADVLLGELSTLASRARLFRTHIFNCPNGRMKDYNILFISNPCPFSSYLTFSPHRMDRVPSIQTPRHAHRRRQPRATSAARPATRPAPQQLQRREDRSGAGAAPAGRTARRQVAAPGLRRGAAARRSARPRRR